MHFLPLIALLSTLLAPILASPLQQSTLLSTATTPPSVAPATYDGTCFYPQPDASHFNLTAYLGTWYQVAGTSVPYTAGCSCTYANYTLNADGSVGVYNSCRRLGMESGIRGTASPVDKAYGERGVFKVKFPFGMVDQCPGPNYIVQEYSDDGQWAIVQASKFSTLFLLTRTRQPGDAAIDAWLAKAAKLGSKMDNVIKISQEGCT